VSTNFDPLLAKVICSHSDWEVCRQLAVTSLEQFDIEGVGTNKAVVLNILNHPLFQENKVLTNFMLKHAEEIAEAPAVIATASVGGETAIPSPLSGNVVAVQVKEGTEVQAGDCLVVLSAMKLETEMRAPMGGRVTAVHAQVGGTVQHGEALVTIRGDGKDAGAAQSVYRAQRIFPATPGPHATAEIEPKAAIGDSIYKKRYERNSKLVAELSKTLGVVGEGGGGKYNEQHLARGKLLARERVKAVVDPGTDWLELSPLAAWEMYDKKAHGAGMVTAVGQVEGRLCVLVVNDATVKGGTYYPMTVKKHLRAQVL